MIHLWHHLSPGPNPPDILHAVVEVPKGSRNKYEYSKMDGVIKLDRVLYSSVHYPGDYGFIPQSYSEDGDPLDVVVIINEPTFPQCVIEVRPIGMLKMLDKGEPDSKILAVPKYDPHYNDYGKLEDVPRHYLREVEHFFGTYKLLEGVTVENLQWADLDAAKEEIRISLQRYIDTFRK
jgi:inorganic pyrophosphatase